MGLNVRHNLVGCEVLRILFAGGDRTGLPVDGLVSYEEKDTSTLDPLDTEVRVVGIRAVRRRLIYR